jgi:hypothetical protein
MQYIIVSTSKCNYQAWQIRLLNWSRKRVNQEGKLIVLLSEDEGHKNENPKFEYNSPDVEVIELPDWASKWKEEHDDWWGGIPNKYESFNWLAAYYPFKDSDILIFLDPDMIFLEPVNIRPRKNQIVGQNWQGYQPLPNWPVEKQAFMYPFVLRFSTLKMIKEHFKNYCFKIRKEINRWESDMWALDYASKANNIDIKYVPRLGVCTAWKDNDNTAPSPIIHYPNVIESKKGKKIFFKQDYTFQPDQKIEIRSARNETDKRLLINIDQERTDFVYHVKWDFEEIFKGYNGKDGNLILKPWPGGFNNIRMSLELGVCLAFLTNRTLILPPTYKMYLLEGTSNFSDFFKTDQLGIKTIDFEEFCKEQNIVPDEKEVKKVSKILDYDSVQNVVNFEKIPVPEWFLKGRETINSEEIFDSETNLFLDGGLLGNFYQSIYSSYDIELKKLIAKYVVYKDELIDLAWEFINYFGDQTYFAIHIRRNDFQYKDLFISCEDILANLKEIVPLYSTLYVATDHKEKEFFKPLEDNYNVVYYDTIANRIDLHPEDVNWIPIIEQLICTRSIKFIGMKLSTLSSYVYRMRGYMNDIDDKEYYLNGEPYNLEKQCTFRDEKDFIANWSREYKCSWDFEKKTIFVSIASYCDTQLFHTLESAIEGATCLSRIVFGVHLQDTQKTYSKLLSKEYPNLKVVFTPKEDAKGVVWARNTLKRELFDGEDFFLQVDAHSRFKKNWDNILIHQYKSINSEKPVITTYPNAFEISDKVKSYEKNKTNSPLKINKFLTENPLENRLRPGNKVALRNYEVTNSKWCAAGFVFAPKDWVRDIEIPDEIIFNGEEDLMTHLSFFHGYSLVTPSEACVWHNYNYKNEKTGKRYKKFNPNLKGDNSMRLINDYLYGHSYSRTLKQLEKFLEWDFKLVEGHATIFVSIASFKDSDIRATIDDCVSKAKYPEKLTFGICWQYDNRSNVNEDYLDDLARVLHIKIAKFQSSESRGVGWARRQAMSFYESETYCLQIDSHTRFVDQWDDILIKEHRNLEKVSDLPILTFLPPSFEQIPYLNTTNPINYPKIRSIEPDYLFEYEDQHEVFPESRNFNIPIVEPCFIFTFGTWAKDVKPNPDIYYSGEELDLSIRSFRMGYDFYTPSEVIAYHGHGNSHSKIYNSHNIDDVRKSHQLSLKSISDLISGENDKNSFRRSFKQYENYLNVDFKNRTVSNFDVKELHFRKKPLKVGLITRCKDEYFIEEFCDYYFNQGIDEINIIDDDSSDKSIYDNLISNDKVKIHFEKNIITTSFANKLYAQIKDNYEWMIYVDVDEFITTKKDSAKTIRDELESTFKDADCIKIPWVMMSPNGLKESPGSILKEITTRMNHDKKHPNSKSKHSKFRCRYKTIEVKSIFKTAMFNDIFDHIPKKVVNNQKPIVVDGVKNKNIIFNSYYNELREEDIRTGYLLCYHYRIISEENCKKKINTNRWYKGYTLDDLMSTDFPEILDETLKTKSLFYEMQEV